MTRNTTTIIIISRGYLHPGPELGAGGGKTMNNVTYDNHSPVDQLTSPFHHFRCILHLLQLDTWHITHPGVYSKQLAAAPADWRCVKRCFKTLFWRLRCLSADEFTEINCTQHSQLTLEHKNMLDFSLSNILVFSSMSRQKILSSHEHIYFSFYLFFGEYKHIYFSFYLFLGE